MARLVNLQLEMVGLAGQPQTPQVKSAEQVVGQELRRVDAATQEYNMKMTALDLHEKKDADLTISSETKAYQDVFFLLVGVGIGFFGIMILACDWFMNVLWGKFVEELGWETTEVLPRDGQPLAEAQAYGSGMGEGWKAYEFGFSAGRRNVNGTQPPSPPYRKRSLGPVGAFKQSPWEKQKSRGLRPASPPQTLPLTISFS
jgi:hypothetical protein